MSVMLWKSTFSLFLTPPFEYRCCRFVRNSLQSNHTRQSLAQSLQPCSLGRLLNFPDQILEIRRLALGFQHWALELVLEEHPC